jgi:hypothetical protein
MLSLYVQGLPIFNLEAPVLFCNPNSNPSSSTSSVPKLNRGGKKYEKGT